MDKYDIAWERDEALLVADQIVADNRESPQSGSFSIFTGKLILTKSHIVFVSKGKQKLWNTDSRTSHLGIEDMSNEGSLTIPWEQVLKYTRGNSKLFGHYASVAVRESYRAQPFCFSIIDPEILKDDHDQDVISTIIWAMEFVFSKNPSQDEFEKEDSHLEYERSRHLNVLELEEGATWGEVKKSYRELSMAWHPDRHPDWMKVRAEAKMSNINESYSWLESDMVQHKAA